MEMISFVVEPPSTAMRFSMRWLPSARRLFFSLRRFFSRKLLSKGYSSSFIVRPLYCVRMVSRHSLLPPVALNVFMANKTSVAPTCCIKETAFKSK